MRSLASVPMAENMSAYLAICSAGFFAWAVYRISMFTEIWADVNGRVSCPERLGQQRIHWHARSLNRM